MLLWVLILALFGACAAWFGTNLASFSCYGSGGAGVYWGGFFGIYYLYVKPVFTSCYAPSMADLNPLLQDLGLALHPPFLSRLCRVEHGIFLSSGCFDRGARRCCLGALGATMDFSGMDLLTIGIALGSWWAYYELGWGGYWFWDPVENASNAVAVGNCVAFSIVVEKRKLPPGTILLAILAFGFSLLGTYPCAQVS